jgi:hypothetical protein
MKDLIPQIVPPKIERLLIDFLVKGLDDLQSRLTIRRVMLWLDLALLANGRLHATMAEGMFLNCSS